MGKGSTIDVVFQKSIFSAKNCLHGGVNALKPGQPMVGLVGSLASCLLWNRNCSYHVLVRGIKYSYRYSKGDMRAAHAGRP